MNNKFAKKSSVHWLCCAFEATVQLPACVFFLSTQEFSTTISVYEAQLYGGKRPAYKIQIFQAFLPDNNSFLLIYAHENAELLKLEHGEGCTLQPTSRGHLYVS